jgi:hypothetical protein
VGVRESRRYCRFFFERPRRSVVEPLQDGSLARGDGGEEFRTNQIPDWRVMEKHL